MLNPDKHRIDGSLPAVDVVIVSYQAEPWLERAVAAALGSAGVTATVYLVDNGCTDGAVDRIEGTEGVVVLRPGKNLGFTGGCNLGASAGTGSWVALVNPDALVEPDALAQLVRHAPAGGIATASVRLADAPERLNSAGNQVHVTGVSWSGNFDEPAADHTELRPALAASGAACLMARSTWQDLGGFTDQLFAYYEDAELSIRAWQRGGSVVYVPSAVVIHRYQFSRRTEKYYLLERNRLIMVLTCWERSTVIRLAPMLIGLELGFLVLGALQGWAGHKVRGWRWLFHNRRWIREQRRAVQAVRTRSDAELRHLFTYDLLPANISLPPGWPVLNAVLRTYCKLVLPRGRTVEAQGAAPAES